MRVAVSILIDINEEWVTGKRYLTLDEHKWSKEFAFVFNLQQIRYSIYFHENQKFTMGRLNSKKM